MPEAPEANKSPWSLDAATGTIKYANGTAALLVCGVPGSPETLSTAMLAAAAPELYVALNDLWNETILSGNDQSSDYGWPRVRTAVLSALAKATGA